MSSPYPYHLTPGGPELIKRALKKCAPAKPWNENSSLLYVGCRHGENALGLANVFPGRITAVDEDSEGVFFAKMRAMQTGISSRMIFKFMSPAKLDVPDRSCDVVILDGMLVASARQRALAEARRVQADDGILLLFDSYWKKTPVPPFVRNVWESPEHRIPTEEEYRELLEDADFTVDAIGDAGNVLGSFYDQFTGGVEEFVRSSFEGVKHRKALIKHYKHEIDVYRRQGGDKYMGYLAARAIKHSVADTSGAAEI